MKFDSTVSLKEVPMDWDEESSVMPDSEPASPTGAPVSTVTLSTTKWRLAKGLSALALVLAIGGSGFILGHDVFTSTPARSAAPRYTLPTFPSGGRSEEH